MQFSADPSGYREIMSNIIQITQVAERLGVSEISSHIVWKEWSFLNSWFQKKKVTTNKDDITFRKAKEKISNVIYRTLKI